MAAGGSAGVPPCRGCRPGAQGGAHHGLTASALRTDVQRLLAAAHVMHVRGHADISRGKKNNTQRPTGSFEVPEPEKRARETDRQTDRHRHGEEEPSRAGWEGGGRGQIPGVGKDVSAALAQSRGGRDGRWHRKWGSDRQPPRWSGDSSGDRRGRQRGGS